MKRECVKGRKGMNVPTFFRPGWYESVSIRRPVHIHPSRSSFSFSGNLRFRSIPQRYPPSSPFSRITRCHGVSIATGLVAARHAVALARGETPRPLPRETALGSLCHYVSGADPRNYQPANITFDLLPQLDDQTRARLKHDRRARHAEVCRRAQAALEEYLASHVGA